MTAMTVELLKATLPKALAGNATQELADHINNIALDPEVADEVRSNFLSYTKVLQDGKFKTESYLDAITYVTHKLMGYSNQDSYIRTFPTRYQTLVAKGVSAKDLSAYVAAYHGNKLVNLILEQSIVPTWLLNRDIYQRAINTQFELMTDPDVSAKVRSDAANSILTHLKQPETKKVELDVGIKNSGGIADLMATMRQLAGQQQELIQAGVPARQVARQRLVMDAEFVEVAPVTPALTAAAPAPAPTAKTDVGFAQAITALDTRVPPGAPPPQGLPDYKTASPSLFQRAPTQRSDSSEGATTGAPSATAAQPPASTAGGEGDGAEGAALERSGGDAVPAFRSSVSLFDRGTFPIGDDA